MRSKRFDIPAGSASRLRRPAAVASACVVAALAAVLAHGARAGGDPYPAPSGEVAFESGGAVYVVDPVGDGGVRRVRAGVRDPAFSPNGKLIAVAGERGIELMSPGGAGLRAVTAAPRPYGDTQPAWSPGGRFIVFTRLLPGYRNPELFRVEVSTRAVRRLTRTSGLAESHPAWSPSGREIVFARARLSVRFAPSSLFQIAPDGKQLRRLSAAPALEPAWSPAGTQLAFSSARGGKQDVWISNATGGQAVDVTRGFAGTNVDPAWSPDGTAIVFASTHGNPTDAYDIWVIGADGASPRRLTRFGATPGGAGAVAPSWQRVP